MFLVLLIATPESARDQLTVPRVPPHPHLIPLAFNKTLFHLKFSKPAKNIANFTLNVAKIIQAQLYDK